MTIRIRRSLKGCLLLVLLFGMIGANGKCDLAMRIWADLQQQIDSQQQQIDQLTGAVCGLSVLTGNPTHPEFCEVVVTETCECEERLDVCACDPGPNFELESCERGSFPHPDSGEGPPPKCGIVDGCRGTFTRIASGDVGSIEVEPTCEPVDPGGSGGCPLSCECGCDFSAVPIVCNDCGEL